MSELIRRQDAIDAMQTWDWQELYLPIHFKQLLEELPPADCDQCGEEVVIPFGKIPFNYCPNCGAKMEVEHEDDYDYERASDMRDYCERYEPTYNPEDGSM